jgi:hypothetical protein
VSRFDRASISRKFDAAAAAKVAAICVTLGGCGQNDWAYVDGVVTLGGEPIGPGTLVFEPISSEQTRSGMAHFADDGRYKLKSAGNKEGLPVGEYRVRVDSRGEEAFGEEWVGPPPASPIPQEYLQYGAGLTATVESGSNTINLELKK